MDLIACLLVFSARFALRPALQAFLDQDERSTVLKAAVCSEHSRQRHH